MQSNFDQIWNEDQKKVAKLEGWELVVVIDSGRPISTAYLDIFNVGPRFGNRRMAQRFVIEQAQKASHFHVNALSACTSSRMSRQAQPKRKK